MLVHGTLSIEIADLECQRCGFVTRCERREMAMFSSSATNIYSRELVEFWLHEASINGGKFRRAYGLPKQLANSASVEIGRL